MHCSLLFKYIKIKCLLSGFIEFKIKFLKENEKFKFKMDEMKNTFSKHLIYPLPKVCKFT